MILLKYDPDEVYKWFMELFIDSYDWVMVPNVYGMSQYSDGGIMSTKPYISGSNYILKMSNYKKGQWSQKWDALYWNFINENRIIFVLLSRVLQIFPTRMLWFKAMNFCFWPIFFKFFKTFTIISSNIKNYWFFWIYQKLENSLSIKFF